MHNSSRIALPRKNLCRVSGLALGLSLFLEPLICLLLLACITAAILNHSQGAKETDGKARGHVAMPVVLCMTHLFDCFTREPVARTLLVSVNLNTLRNFQQGDHITASQEAHPEGSIIVV